MSIKKTQVKRLQQSLKFCLELPWCNMARKRICVCSFFPKRGKMCKTITIQQKSSSHNLINSKGDCFPLGFPSFHVALCRQLCGCWGRCWAGIGTGAGDWCWGLVLGPGFQPLLEADSCCSHFAGRGAGDNGSKARRSQEMRLETSSSSNERSPPFPR